MPEKYGSNKCQVTVALDASYSVLLDFNLAIVSHTLKHCPSRPLYLLLNIDIPQPPQPFLERLLQPLLVISHAIQTQTQQIRILFAGRHNFLASRTPYIVITLEGSYYMLGLGYPGITQEFSQDVGIFNGLSGSGSLMRSGCMCSIPKNGDSGACVCRDVRVLEDGPL